MTPEKSYWDPREVANPSYLKEIDATKSTNKTVWFPATSATIVHIFLDWANPTNPELWNNDHLEIEDMSQELWCPFDEPLPAPTWKD